jgi:hypothetical protein
VAGDGRSAEAGRDERRGGGGGAGGLELDQEGWSDEDQQEDADGIRISVYSPGGDGGSRRGSAYGHPSWAVHADPDAEQRGQQQRRRRQQHQHQYHSARSPSSASGVDGFGWAPGGRAGGAKDVRAQARAEVAAAFQEARVTVQAVGGCGRGRGYGGSRGGRGRGAGGGRGKIPVMRAVNARGLHRRKPPPPQSTGPAAAPAPAPAAPAAVLFPQLPRLKLPLVDRSTGRGPLSQSQSAR